MSHQESFIARVLTSSGNRMLKNQGTVIQASVTANSTGHLFQNRSVNISQNQLKFEHPLYERFLDMKTLHRDGKVVKRKPLRIHNRFMFGHYLNIASQLMNGLTSEVAQNIRQKLTLKHLD